jgi:RNA polymerase sigma-70 factor (ECF subfamily)
MDAEAATGTLVSKEAGMEREALVTAEEKRLLDGLRAREEWAFAELVQRYGPSMLRLARTYVSSRAVAEEVVQDAFLGALSGIDRFEGRSSVKTWLFRILTNRAKTLGAREARSAPFSSLGEADGPTVESERFLDSTHRWAGHWSSAPQRFDAVPHERLLAAETTHLVAATIATLPSTQGTVITLRDVEGWSSEEVCELLSLTEANQRVLLHRARARVRGALEHYLLDTAGA